MPNLRIRADRLEKVAPIPHDAGGPTMAPDEIARRLAVIQDTTGEDLAPALERVGAAHGKAEESSVLATWTNRQLVLVAILLGDMARLHDTYGTPSPALTAGERAALLVACAGWDAS